MKKLRSWLHHIGDSFGDKTLDDICADLRHRGMDAEISPSARWGPEIPVTKQRSVGMVNVRQGPVKWINYRYATDWSDTEAAGMSQPWYDFGIPDSRFGQRFVDRGFSNFYIKSIKVRKKNHWSVGLPKPLGRATTLVWA